MAGGQGLASYTPRDFAPVRQQRIEHQFDHAVLTRRHPYRHFQFIAELDMPPSLRLVKIGPESFERIAEQAMGTPWVPHNPRRIDGPAHVREILQLAA